MYHLLKHHLSSFTVPIAENSEGYKTFISAGYDIIFSGTKREVEMKEREFMREFIRTL